MQSKPADTTVSGAKAVLAIVGRAHDLVAELKPTPAESRALVDFLTELGHPSDARRQEWALLAEFRRLRPGDTLPATRWT